MRFGLGPFSGEAGGRVGPTEAYEIMGDAVQRAENLGFDSAWVTERYFSPDGYTPSAFVAAANLAARTESIRIGAMSILGLDHPLYFAEEAATLDNLSGGRAIVVPINAVAHELKAYSIPESEYAERFRESLEVLLKAWSARPFHHQGSFWTIPAQLEGHTENLSGLVNVTPKPVQFELPLWIGGFWAEGRSIAAELGLPMVVGAIANPDELGGIWSTYEQNTRRAVRAPRVIVRDVYLSNGPNPLDECGAMFAVQFERYNRWGLWTGDATDVAKLAKDRLIYGNPDQVIAQIKALDDEHELDHLICRMHFPGMPLSQLFASMNLFAREVIPEFKMPDLPSQIRNGV